MKKEKKREIEIAFAGVIREFCDDHGLEISPYDEIELSTMLFAVVAHQFHADGE